MRNAAELTDVIRIHLTGGESAVEFEEAGVVTRVGVARRRRAIRTRRMAVRPEPRAARQRAAVLVILGAALWWHAWMPGALLVAFVIWAVFHTRYQGTRREGFMRLRRRVWPPAALVLVALIVAATAVYGLSSDSIEAKVLPIALNVVALSLLVLGRKRAAAARLSSEALAESR